MRNTDKQAYDRGTTIFSPDGRLYQVEYAREAVKQGSPVVGVRAAEAVVLSARVSSRSPLVEAGSVEKLYPVDGRIGIAAAGHAADARQLVDLARRTAQGERLRYDEPTTVEALSTTIADHVQENTQTGGARPYGTGLLIAGYDDAPRLFETDPSGATSEWAADAVGRGAEAAVERFEDAYATDLTVEDALGLAIEGLEATADDLDVEQIDAAVIDEEGYQPVTSDRLAGVVDPDRDR